MRHRELLVMSGRLRSDRGASAIVVATSLLVLMGFAAVAIDSGVAFDDRRQQQSAADVGALAALQFARTTITTDGACTGLSGDAYSACRGAEEAVEVINDTLNDRFAFTGDVHPDWVACTDPDRPAEYTIVATLYGETINCISFTENFQQSRVRLPTTAVDTSFGRLIGQDTIDVSAVAEAGLEMQKSADVLPFAVGPTGADSSQACLFANASVALDVAPCNGPDEGNFGYLDVSLYGNSKLGTSVICGNAFTTDKLAVNIVVGSDHPLEEQWHASGVVDDFTNCNNIANPVDQVHTWTGNATPGLEDGLFNGISTPALEGRLMCKGSLSSDTSGEASWNEHESLYCENVLNVYPEDLDHSPLWEYIASGANAEVKNGVCLPNGNVISNRQEMEACLDGWKQWAVENGPHTISLFTQDLINSPRFGAVPILDNDPSNGTGAYLIEDFVPAYVSTIYLQCSGQTCNVVHSPGESSTGACPATLSDTDNSCGWTGNGVKPIDVMTSFILSVDMLDLEHQTYFPGRPGTVVYNLLD